MKYSWRGHFRVGRCRILGPVNEQSDFPDSQLAGPLSPFARWLGPTRWINFVGTVGSGSRHLVANTPPTIADFTKPCPRSSREIAARVVILQGVVAM
jgi:hypothetical protein